MLQRVLTLLAAGLVVLAAVPARSLAAPVRPLDGSASPDVPSAEGSASAAGDAAAVREPSARLDLRAAGTSPYREHAPLALFSLGSLAVGGVFYGIHRSWDASGASASGDGTRVDTALGAAGLSALAAGAAYLWYTLRADRPGTSGWTETLAAGVTPDGAVAATVTWPLTLPGD